MLSVKNIDVYYDKVQALSGVSIEVGDQEIISIIGSNGAGKSTLMKAIMGVNRPRKGIIDFMGTRISAAKTHDIVSRGIVYVPEGREIFPDMTVRENLEMGAYCRKFSKAELKEHIDNNFGLFPRLRERQGQLAGTMSGGEQQMLAISRGLMSSPKLIMLDEPSLGLAPVLVDEMFDAIVRIHKEQKIPIVIVEQNAFTALSISDRAYVLEVGRIAVSGQSRDLIGSPDIKKAYLGGE